MTKMLKIKFRKILILILSCAATLLFLNPINGLLDTFLVIPIFSMVEGNIVNSVIVLSIGSLLIIWLWIESGLKYRLGWIAFILFFYMIQRFNPYWHFHPLSFSPHIYLWDIVVFSLIFPACRTIFSILPQDELSDAPNEGGFLEERPVKSIAEDSFKRNTVAKEIAKLIGETRNKNSFAIGILGGYGSGKTSFINLIEENLVGSVEIIHFNPWSSEQATNIQKDFFDLLADHLYKNDPNLSHLILAYSRKLKNIESWWEQILKRASFISGIFQSDLYSDDYETIDRLLQKSSKKIVVAIDDLDRLRSNEIIEVLGLIRNTANFANIVFLVAYEKGYVQEAISALNSKATFNYLDKIVQLEIPLPAREQDDLLSLLLAHAEHFLNPHDLILLKGRVIQYGFRNDFDTNFKTVFRNARDVIKFINSFIIPYRLLGEEVYFENLFVLELIKFRFPILYEELHSNRSRFLSKKSSRSNHNETYELRMEKDGERKKPTFLETLGNDYSSADKKLISGLFQNLFSGYTKSKTKNAIVYPMFFDRYFRFRIGNEISEKEYKKSLENGWPQLKDYIDYCVSRNLHDQILDRIFQEKINHREAFELITKAIFYIGPKYVLKKAYSSFDDRILIDHLWNYDGRITKNFYKENETAYSDFLIGLFESAPEPYIFNNSLIHSTLEGTQDIGVSRGHLISIQCSYFSKYIDKHGFTKDGVWLMWGIQEKYTTPTERPGYVYEHRRLLAEVVPILKNKLREHDPTQFLIDSIQSEPRAKDIAKIYDQILGIFDHPDDLKILVEESTFLSEDIRTEYLSFFEQCRLVDFKKMIQFDFRTELRPKKSYDD